MIQPESYLEKHNQVTVKVTLIIPIYFNAANIPVTWTAVCNVLNQLPQWLDWEVLFVDDGSGDESYSVLKTLQAAEPHRVRVVKFTRNFGQVAAILAGLQRARGDCCIVMSADLQDPPELILEMLNRWSGGKTKIVVANRENREDGRITRATSRIFYKMMQRYAISNMPQGGFDFFLVDKRVVHTTQAGDRTVTLDAWEKDEILHRRLCQLFRDPYSDDNRSRSDRVNTQLRLCHVDFSPESFLAGPHRGLGADHDYHAHAGRRAVGDAGGHRRVYLAQQR
jgi:glycosyltransferase involved in cell wall biosynthesis